MIREDITDKLIRVEITNDMIERARERAQIDKAIYGFRNSTSFTTDKNRFLGMLGEEAVSSYFKTPLTNTPGFNPPGWDIILKGEKVEIKSQGLNINRVWNYYDVNAERLSKECDKYMFIIVHNSFRYAFIVGQMERRKFNDNCRRKWFKGDLQYYVTAAELERV